MKERIERFLDDRFAFLSVALVLLFSVYRVIQYCFLEPRCIYALGPGQAIFFLAVLAVVILYRRSSTLKVRGMITVLLVSVILMQAAVFVAGMPHEWHDEEEYYQIGLYALDTGPVKTISEWHRLILWDENLQQDFESRIDSYGIRPFAEEAFSGSIGREEIGSRPAVSTPVWPLIISLFLYINTSRFMANVAAWLFTSLVPILMFLWSKNFTDERTSFRLAMVFIMVPSFLMVTVSPVPEGPLTLISLLALVTVMKYLKSGEFSFLLLTGVFFSLAFLFKPTSIVLLIPLSYLLYAHSPERKGRLIDIMVMVSVSAIGPLVLFLLDYNIILNVVSAQSFHSVFLAGKGIGNPIFFLLRQFPKDITYFGVPLLVLGAAGLLGFRKRNFGDRFTLVAVLAVAILSVAVLSPLYRYLVPFLPLFLFPLIRKGNILERNFELILVLMAVQSFLFLSLPAV
jgi:hypothetical protein